MVYGNSGISYVVTDILRGAGLSVGAWLLPPSATPQRATDEFVAELAGGIPDQWLGAAVGISLWRSPCTAAVVDPAARIALAVGGRWRARWLDLSPHGLDAIRDSRVRHAPLLTDWTDRLYLPAHTARRLDAEASAAALDPAAAVYERTVRALLGALPSIPAAIVRGEGRRPLITSAVAKPASSPL